MARMVVTGGAGFIGHHLVAGLIARGDVVTVVDDLSTGHADRLATLGDRVRLIEASVLDRTALDAALAGVDTVFHLAAVASVARSMDEPALVNEINVGGTIEVVEAGARAGVRRVVLAGSSAVYGTPHQLPCHEGQRPEPVSPYGVGKLAAEHYLHTLGRWHGIDTVALRYFNVFGPRQSPDSEYAAVVPRFIAAALNGSAPVINGSGAITRDYIYVGDVVRANLLAAAPSTGSGITCNIAAGRETSLLDLVALVAAATGTEVTPVLGPPRAGDVPRSVADVSLARDILGFVALISLDEGIRRTADGFGRSGELGVD